jgi:hypothetical protein
MASNEKQVIHNLVQIGQLFKVQVRSQWPRSLRRRSAAAGLLTLWGRILPGYGNLSLVSVVCCQVESLRRADSSSRGYVCVCMRACVRV